MKREGDPPAVHFPRLRSSLHELDCDKGAPPSASINAPGGAGVAGRRSDRLRILILHSRYLSGASGENQVVEDEARLLREAGHQVWVWSPSPEVATVPARVHASLSAVWSAAAMKHTARLVEHHRIDVLHAHNLFPLLSPSVLRAGRAAGAAVVVTLHNYRLLCLPATFLRDGTACESCLGRLPWRGALYRCYRESFIGSTVLATSIGLHRGLQTFNAVHRFIAVSDFVRRKHVEGGLPAERISVKANFSWPMEQRSGPGEYFLYIGRLSKEKGVELLMRAWSRGNPPGRLVIVGDGPEAASLRRNAPTSVEFRGQVPSDQVPAILGGARALLLPSACYEAAPKTIVEAYAAGVPVVASDIGAIPDSVRSDVTGYLAPSGDADAWVALATRLMDDGECQRLGRGARALWAERHSPERVLVQLEDIYADALLARAQV